MVKSTSVKKRQEEILSLLSKAKSLKEINELEKQYLLCPLVGRTDYEKMSVDELNLLYEYKFGDNPAISSTEDVYAVIAALETNKKIKYNHDNAIMY